MKRRSFRRKKRKIIPELHSSSFLSSSGFVSNENTKKTNKDTEYESDCDHKWNNTGANYHTNVPQSFESDFSNEAYNEGMYARKQDQKDIDIQDDRDSDQEWWNTSSNNHPDVTNDNKRDFPNDKEDSVTRIKKDQIYPNKLQDKHNPIKKVLCKLRPQNMSISKLQKNNITAKLITNTSEIMDNEKFEEVLDSDENMIDDSSYTSSYSSTIDENLTLETSKIGNRNWDKQHDIRSKHNGGTEEREAFSSTTRNGKREESYTRQKFDETDYSFSDSNSYDEMCASRPKIKFKKKQRTNLKKKHIHFLNKRNGQSGKIEGYQNKHIVDKTDQKTLPENITKKESKPVYKTNVKISKNYRFDDIRDEVEQILEKTSKKAVEYDLSSDKDISCEEKRSTTRKEMEVHPLENDHQSLQSTKDPFPMQPNNVDEYKTNDNESCAVDNKSCENGMFCDSFFQIECLGWKFFKHKEHIPTQGIITDTSTTQASTTVFETSEKHTNPKTQEEVFTSPTSVVESIYRNNSSSEKRIVSKQVGWTSSVDVIELLNNNSDNESYERLNNNSKKNDLNCTNIQHKQLRDISPCKSNSHDDNETHKLFQEEMKLSKESSNVFKTAKITTEKMKKGSYDMPIIPIDFDPNVSDQIIMDAFTDTFVC